MAVRLSEWLQPLVGKSHTIRVLAVVYHLIEHEGMLGCTTGDVKTALERARDRTGTAGGNLSRATNKCAAEGWLHDTGQAPGRAILRDLTDTGRAIVRAAARIEASAHAFKPS